MQFFLKNNVETDDQFLFSIIVGFGQKIWVSLLDDKYNLFIPQIFL